MFLKFRLTEYESRHRHLFASVFVEVLGSQSQGFINVLELLNP